MHEPRLSVVIPSYNAARFLPACVASIRTAGEPSVQIIVVDDGSTDNTREVAASLDVVYIYQTNQKLPAARNTGMTLVTGQYVAYLDADDTWKPGVLPKLLGLLDREPEVVLAHANADFGNETMGYVPMLERITETLPAYWDLPHRMVDGVRIFEHAPYRRLLMSRNLVFLGAAVTRTEIVRKTRGFHVKLRAAEDWQMLMQLSEFGTTAFLNESMAFYYQHDSNMSRNQELMVNGFCEARRTILEHPENLPADVQQILRAGLEMESLYYADLAYGRGDYATARERYDKVRQESGLSKPAIMGLLMSRLPKSIIDMLRGMKK
jgi:glycosyltransferase involved in cell wall biosynthesis